MHGWPRVNEPEKRRNSPGEGKGTARKRTAKGGGIPGCRVYRSRISRGRPSGRVAIPFKWKNSGCSSITQPIIFASLRKARENFTSCNVSASLRYSKELQRVISKHFRTSEILPRKRKLTTNKLQQFQFFRHIFHRE